MADGVFGNPITTRTLEGMSEYRGKKIRRSDMAKVARDLMNAGGKDTSCVKYVENLREEYGDGPKTLCTIYNATGDDLTFITFNDWCGHIYSKPYPIVIKNGQWAGFVHVHPYGRPAGSSGAVVYRGLNNNDVECDWMMSWSVPWVFGSNTAYTEIRERGHYEAHGFSWGKVQQKMEKGKKNARDEWNGCVSNVAIGFGDSTSFVGIASLTGPNPPYLAA